MSYGQERIIRTNSFEMTIAKLYVFFLPFRMIVQLSFLKNIFGVCANNFSFVFHIIGLFIWIINEHGQISFGNKSKLIRSAGRLVLYLNMSSIFMACLMQFIYGNHGSENAFQGIAGMIVYFFQYFFMFVYNYRVFRLLSVDCLDIIISRTCLVIFVIGIIQVFVQLGIGSSLYDSLNVLGIVNSSSKLSKISLTGSEGASAGGIISIFVMPYLMSKIIVGEKKSLISVFLWLIPLYFTFSSTAYILFVVDLIVFVGLLINRSPNRRVGWSIVLSIVLISVVLFLLLFLLGVIDSEKLEKFRYILFVKPFAYDRDGSTATRTVPLLMNWGAFKEFPLFGVGNGLQGYFFEKYFPEWAYHVAGSDILMYVETNTNEISNGAAFIPSLVSGYGVVGCTIIACFVLRVIKENEKNRYDNDKYYYMFIIAGFAFLVFGFMSDVYANYYLWFMLSTPLICNRTTCLAELGRDRNK